MVLIAVVALAVLVSNVMSATSPPTVKYSQFVTELQSGQVNSAQVNANNGEIQFQDVQRQRLPDAGPGAAAGPQPGRDAGEVPEREGPVVHDAGDQLVRQPAARHRARGRRSSS